MTHVTNTTGVATYDHFALMSVDLIKDLTFYEQLFGARLLARTPGRARQVGERPPFVNFSVHGMKKGLPAIVFMGIAGSVWGLFLQRDYPPAPDRMQQGPRQGLSVPAEEFDAAVKTLDELGIQYEGPYEHEPESQIVRSVYFRDPSGNSVEVCVEKNPPRVSSSGSQGRIAFTRLCHLALDVSDLAKAEDIYGRALGMKLAYRGKTADGLPKSVLHLDSGQVVTLQEVGKVPDRLAWKTCGLIHMAFVIEEENWKATEDRLASCGIQIMPDPVRHEGGRVETQESIYFRDHDNNMIQIFTPNMVNA
jgi:catechol 2,3-dioxygenase-like lactoylglutathione lyase family enzyme